MATFLRETEDFLARLPSINLDGMDPLQPGQQLVKGGHRAPEAVARQQPMLLDPKHVACTITTGPAPYEQQPYMQAKTARPSSSTYSPDCTLYPLTSLESYTNAEMGNASDSQDLDADMDMGSAGGLPGSARGSGQVGSCESDAAEELGLRRSSRSSASRKDKGGPKEKRKVGRPIAYCGDPDSPDLTPSERRRIKRRIANRESARRVRARRQEQIEEMAVKAHEMERHNMQLATHASSVETQHSQMMRQLGEYTARLQSTAAQNEQLQAEIEQLRAFITSKGMKLEEGTDGQQEGEKQARSAAATSKALPANHSSLGHIAANPSGCDAPVSSMGADRHAYSSAMQSAFAAAAGNASREGGVHGAVLQMPDVPMNLGGQRAGSRAGSGVLLLGLGNAGSLDQLLPPIDPHGLGMSLNDFLLGEA